MEEEVEMRMINRKEYNGNAVLSFFDELLDFMEEIRELYDITSNPYMMITVGKESQNINLLEENCSEKLLDSFERLYFDGTAKEIIVKEELSCSNDVHRINYSKKNRNFSMLFFKDEDIERLQTAQAAMDNSFVDDEIKNGFVEQLAVVKKIYEEQPRNRLWKREQIFKYLNSYYQLLCLLLSDTDILMTEGIVDQVLLPILNLGIKKNEEGGIYLSMTAPVVLSGLNLIYSRLDQFVTLQFSNESRNKKIENVENILYKDIFLSKIHQLFRFFIVLENQGELYHAALPIYDEKK